MTATARPPLAQQLLDAQVAHLLDRLHGPQLDTTVTAVAGRVLDASATLPIDDLVDRAVVRDVVTRALTTVPGSAAVSGLVEMAVGVVLDGPQASYPLGEVVDRDGVERVLDEALALTPVLERGLERLTASPMVGVAASRFMGRIVGEVVAANQAVAAKVPGLGSLMSLGTSAASRVVGAADKQLEGLLGDTMGKGGTYAVRRLNKIVVETLQDPTTREAVLQVWDLVAAEEVGSLDEHVSHEDVAGLVDAVHDLVIGTLADEHVVALGHAVVEAFFDRFGGYTPTELLDELDLDRAEIVDDLVRLAPGVVAALEATGDLDRLARAALEPFWDSPEVAALLG